MFKAFSTTTPDGMGLNLAICRAAMDRHGGTITLENRAASGAVARLETLIPVHAETHRQSAIVRFPGGYIA